MSKAYSYLHGNLTNRDLRDLASADRGKFSLLNLAKHHPMIMEWLRLKSALSLDLLRDWRETITAYGGAEKELSANAFMPPQIQAIGKSSVLRHISSFAPRDFTVSRIDWKSSSIGVHFLLAHMTAAIPAACPSMEPLVITRAEDRAS